MAERIASRNLIGPARGHAVGRSHAAHGGHTGVSRAAMRFGPTGFHR